MKREILAHVLRQEHNMIETPFAIDQFVNDYMLVVENDREAWDEITQEARRVDYKMTELSDSIKEQYEQLIAQVLENTREDVTEFAHLLLSQLLLGWGASAFDSIARQVIARDREALGIKTEVA
jgi:hypothetical protein